MEAEEKKKEKERRQRHARSSRRRRRRRRGAHPALDPPRAAAGGEADGEARLFRSQPPQRKKKVVDEGGEGRRRGLDRLLGTAAASEYVSREARLRRARRSGAGRRARAACTTAGSCRQSNRASFNTACKAHWLRAAFRDSTAARTVPTNTRCASAALCARRLPTAHPPSHASAPVRAAAAASAFAHPCVAVGISISRLAIISTPAQRRRLHVSRDAVAAPPDLATAWRAQNYVIMTQLGPDWQSSDAGPAREDRKRLEEEEAAAEEDAEESSRRGGGGGGGSAGAGARSPHPRPATSSFSSAAAAPPSPPPAALTPARRRPPFAGDRRNGRGGDHPHADEETAELQQMREAIAQLKQLETGAEDLLRSSRATAAAPPAAAVPTAARTTTCYRPADGERAQLDQMQAAVAQMDGANGYGGRGSEEEYEDGDDDVSRRRKRSGWRNSAVSGGAGASARRSRNCARRAATTTTTTNRGVRGRRGRGGGGGRGRGHSADEVLRALLRRRLSSGCDAPPSAPPPPASRPPPSRAHPSPSLLCST